MRVKFSPETLFDEMNKCHETGNHRTAIIVFKQSNFKRGYSEKSRSYRSYSDQWGWDYSKLGNCRLGDCLDGSDQGVRLDYYDWEVEFWYWEQNNKTMKDANNAERYTMTNDELYKVYKKLEDFVADCTTAEYIENKSAIDSVFSLIHKHQQRARFNYLTDLINKYSNQIQEGYMLDVNSKHNLLLAIRELTNFGTEEADRWVVKGREILKRRVK